jgi:hypothetical protein
MGHHVWLCGGQYQPADLGKECLLASYGVEVRPLPTLYFLRRKTAGYTVRACHGNGGGDGIHSSSSLFTPILIGHLLRGNTNLTTTRPISPPTTPDTVALTCISPRLSTSRAGCSLIRLGSVARRGHQFPPWGGLPTWRHRSFPTPLQAAGQPAAQLPLSSLTTLGVVGSGHRLPTYTQGPIQ